MKSKILNKFVFEDICLSPEQCKLQISGHAFDDELNVLVKKHFIMRDATSNETATEQDFIMATLKSENPKYNKPILPLTLGLNLFNSEVEKNIIGMKVGDVKTIQLGDTSIEIKVNSVKKKETMQISDELVKKEGIENVNTIEEYRDYCTDVNMKQIRIKKVNDVIEILIPQLKEKCEFTIDTEELEEYVKLKVDYLMRVIVSEETTVVNWIKNKMNITSDLTEEDAKIYLRGLAEDEFKVSILAEKCCNDKGIEVTEQDYENHIKEIVTRQNMDEAYSDVLRKFYPLKEHIWRTYMDNFMDMILKK